MPTQRFLLFGNEIAQRPHYSPFPMSLMHICPTCGQLWGAVLTDGAEFLPLRIPCSAHEWAGMIPGSLLQSGYFDGPLPPEVLRHEVLTLLTHLERISRCA